MNVLKKIKSFFYQSKLKNHTKKSENIPREMININHAEKIGIIFNATRTDDIVTVTQFADKLRSLDKEVLILGYQDRNLKKEEDSRFFDNKNINWYGIPKSEKIDKFQKIPLDILISAFKEECLPLEYIVATSKAKFRVGAFGKAKTNFYELMINVKEDQTLKYLLQQILHFLKVINKDAQ